MGQSSSSVTAAPDGRNAAGNPLHLQFAVNRSFNRQENARKPCPSSLAPNWFPAPVLDDFGCCHRKKSPLWRKSSGDTCPARSHRPVSERPLAVGPVPVLVQQTLSDRAPPRFISQPSGNRMRTEPKILGRRHLRRPRRHGVCRVTNSARPTLAQKMDAHGHLHHDPPGAWVIPSSHQSDCNRNRDLICRAEKYFFIASPAVFCRLYGTEETISPPNVPWRKPMAKSKNVEEVRKEKQSRKQSRRL